MINFSEVIENKKEYINIAHKEYKFAANRSSIQNNNYWRLWIRINKCIF